MSSKDNSNSKSAKKLKTFKNFAEYWHYVRNLPESQKKILINSMDRNELHSLKSSYMRGGWEDLFMRNACDEILDEIKKHTGVDLILIRVEVLSGKPYLMNKEFWKYINSCFDDVSYSHLTYIFDNIEVEEFDDDYIKLTKE